jgi:outer membrane protein W
MKGVRFLYLSIFIFTQSSLLYAQDLLNTSWLKSLSLMQDTLRYDFHTSKVKYHNNDCFYIPFTNNNEFDINISLANDSIRIQSVSTSEVYFVDSLFKIQNNQWLGKIRITPNANQLARWYFKLEERGVITTKEIIFYCAPVFTLKMPNTIVEGFEGEYLIVDLIYSEGKNIKLKEEWTFLNKDIEYKFVKVSNEIKLKIKANSQGVKNVTLPVELQYPILYNNQLNTQLEQPLSFVFVVKPSRLSFLNFNKKDHFLDLNTTLADEMQLDFNARMQLNVIYRIEDKAEAGGKLIAEMMPIYHISTTDKTVVKIRFYSLHKTGEGYLYIKDDKGPKFITNFNVYAKPSVTEVSLLRDGEDWSKSLFVYPGETIELRIEGSGLLKSQFGFENCIATLDTSRLSDDKVFYTVQIPRNIGIKKIPILLNGKKVSDELFVKEYQRPRDFDFINVRFQQVEKSITDPYFNTYVYYKGVLQDLVLDFDENKIDDEGLYGKQYIQIEVKITSRLNRLVEIQHLPVLTICPGEASVRYLHYENTECFQYPLSINNYLNYHTHELDGWEKIEVTVKHVDARYTKIGYERKITFIRQQWSEIEMQAAFPTGLLVKTFETGNVGKFTGISTTVMAQVRFYDKNRLGRIKPYSVGLGFIALDAFNLSKDNSVQDLGIISMGTLYPTNRDSRLSFPLYLGVGYLLQKGKFFALFGPGIQYNF